MRPKPLKRNSYVEKFLTTFFSNLQYLKVISPKSVFGNKFCCDISQNKGSGNKLGSFKRVQHQKNHSQHLIIKRFDVPEINVAKTVTLRLHRFTSGVVYYQFDDFILMNDLNLFFV